MLAVRPNGGIETFDLAEGQTLVFDSGHVLAFTASMRPSVGPLGSVTTAALSGEDLVAQMHGPGRVWVQTRSVVELGKWLMPEKPRRTAGSPPHAQPVSAFRPQDAPSAP